MKKTKEPKNLKKVRDTYFKVQTTKDKFVKPFVLIFDAIGLRPNHLSYFSLALMTVFIFFTKKHLKLSIIFIAITILLDLIDGALARYQKIASDKGRFTDVFCDYLNSCLFFIGLCYLGLVSAPLAFILATAMGISRALRAFNHSRHLKTNWLFCCVVGFTPTFFSHAAYVAFAIYVLFGINLITPTLVVSSIVLIIDSIREYNKIMVQ